MSDRPDHPDTEEAPRPEPVERPAEPIVAEPREAAPDVEPIPVQAAAPIQIAPDPGTEPVAAEPPHPEPASEPGERPGPEAAADEAPDAIPDEAPDEPAHTEETLALPPAIPDPPQSSQPERMPALEGVAVPFAAPPSERNSGRFAAMLAVGIGGGAAIAIAAVVALVISLFTLTEAYLEKIEDTAETFIADIADEQWDDAYTHLCPDMRDRPVQDYVETWESWEADSADVQPVREEMSGTYVPVELADGSTVELRILIEQGAQSVDTTVCGWDRTD